MFATRTVLCASLIAACAAPAMAQKNPGTMSLAGGKLELEAPADWVRKQPRTRIVEYEFEIPAAEGDQNDGRLTVMSAGGGVEANIERWYGQFKQPDGGSTKEQAKVEKIAVADQEVYLVDISGTFSDRRGPFAPAVERPDYRMLAAIIPTAGGGDQFIKFYGPAKTVAENQQAFRKMIDGLKTK
ncbi:MAG: hypothetical protein DWQ37_12515 [Planctomycetota bacterium]|nr:MAG: hypothetical protein DWQ37_12515 [Planctomycetota bacterium]